jgi:hypothetical protein
MRLSDLGLALLFTLCVSTDVWAGEPEHTADDEPPSLAALEPGINAAIDRGVEHLLRRQLRDGSWEGHQDVYRNGQTALSVYALLKSGVSADHPAIERALSFLRESRPTRTYSAGVELLMLKALNDPANLEWAEQDAELLVEWENDSERGAWAYPDSGADLSNSQIAALGMWAAAHMGVKHDRGAWKRLVETTLSRFHEEPVEVEWSTAERSGKRRIAGFTYYSRGQGHPATGSMTAAGLCILALGEELVAKDLGGSLRREVDEAQRMALEWLDYHWALESNPGQEGGGVHYYYLYGLERVGALYELEEIGSHPWYRAGAEVLLRKQEGNGSWGGESDSCFALLFLSRATHPSSGPTAASQTGMHASVEGELHLKAMSKEDVVLFVDGFSQEALASPLLGEGEGLLVLRVEYLVDGEIFAQVEGDASRPWQGERYPVRYQPGRRAEHEFGARVLVVPPLTDPASVEEPRVLEAQPMKFTVEESSARWISRMASFDRVNLLRGVKVEALRTSTQRDEGRLPEYLLDGREGSYWCSAASDREPWLRLALKRPLRAAGVRLAPAAARRDQFDQFDLPLKIQVQVNRDDPQVVELDSARDPLEPLILTFPKRTRVRQLEVRVLERRAMREQSVGTGFAEVGLFDE